MLGMGLLLTPEDIRVVFRRPSALAVGLGLQLLVAPLIAFLLMRGLPLEIGIAAGLALVAAVPGGTLSNIFTYLGGGNIALSVSLTGVTTLGSLLTTPILLRLLLAAHLPPDLEMPVDRVVFDIAVVLLLPLLVGMLLCQWLPRQRRWLSRWSIRASLGFIAAMIVGSAGAGRLDPMSYGWTGPLTVFVLAIAFALAAQLATRLARLPDGDRLAIGIEVTLRNTNLAILVKASLFPAVAGVADPIGDGMFFVALLYGGIQLGAAGLLILLSRRRLARRGS